MNNTILIDGTRYHWYHGTYHVRKNCVLDLKIGHGIISVPTRYPAWED